MTNDPLDPDLSDTDVYKFWHDALHDSASREINNTIIKNTISSLSCSSGDRVTAYGIHGTMLPRELFASEQLAFDNAGSVVPSCDPLLAARDLANNAWSSSDQHRHQSLMALFQKDADAFRKTIVGVRDPKEQSTPTFKEGDEISAVTNRLCSHLHLR